MFFKKDKNSKKHLSDVVVRKYKTGYVFIDINNDLGDSCEEIAKESPLLLMAYAYARRVAVAALYVQGLVEKELYDHVLSIFKMHQYKTGHTVDFQEEAAQESTLYMQQYHPLISGIFENMVVSIAQEYELPKGRNLNDEELFSSVLETLFAEQSKSNIADAGISIIKMIELYGFEYSVNHVAQLVIKRIPNTDVAYQFVLEELDGAMQGNQDSLFSALYSGIDESEFSGALKNSNPFVDGADGPQQFLLKVCLELVDDRDLMAKFRCQVRDEIMKFYSFGKYSPGYEDDIPF